LFAVGVIEWLCGCDTGQEMFVNVMSVCCFILAKVKYLQNSRHCENKIKIYVSVAIICTLFTAECVCIITCILDNISTVQIISAQFR